MSSAFSRPLCIHSHAVILGGEMTVLALALFGVLPGLIFAVLTVAALGAAWLSGRLSRPDPPGDTQTGREAVTEALGADPWPFLPEPRTPIRHANTPART